MNNRTTFAVVALTTALAAATGCDMFVDETTRIERARAHLAEQDYRTAEIELKNVLRSNPENLTARVVLGESLLIRGDTEAAIKELRRARELGAAADAYMVPLAEALLRQNEAAQVIEFDADALTDKRKRAELLALIGAAEFSRGNLGPARQRLEAALAADAHQPRALLTLARIARERGDPDEAERQLRVLLDAHPDDHAGLAALAEMKIATGDAAAAEQHYVRAIEAASEPGEAMKRLEYRIGLIEAQVRQGKNEQAQRTGLEAMQASNDHPAALMQAARADFAAGDYDAVIEKTERIVTVAPEYDPPRLLLAAAAIAQQNNALAVTHLESVLQGDPDHSGARKLLAQARMNLGSPDEALQTLQPLLAAGSEDAQLLAMAGTASIRSGQAEAGIELMQRGVEAASDDPAIMLQAAANFLAAGEINQAIEVLEALPESEQISNRELLLILALLRRGDTEAARSQAQSILDSRPGDAAAHRLMGGFHLAIGEFAEARKQFGKAVEIDPSDIAAVVHLARIDVELEEPDRAEARFRGVLEREPANLVALTALAQLAARRGAAGEAAELLERAASANPQAPAPRLALARFYLQTGQLVLAAERADAAARIAPANGDAHMLLGLARLAQERGSEALPSLERAVKLAPNSAIAHFHLGRAQQKLGTLDAAYQSYERALELDEKLFPARAGMAGVAYRRGDFNRALEIVDTLAEDYPERVEPLVLRGDIEMARGDTDAALEAFERAAAKQPTRELAMKRAEVLRQLGRKGYWTVLEDWVLEHPDDADARTALGRALIASGNLERAMSEFEMSYASAPSAPVATAIAGLHATAYRFDEAAEWLRKALQTDPNFFAAQVALSGVELRRGNSGRALELARELRSEYPDRVAVHQAEGDALMATGDHRAAAEAFQRALAIEPSQPLVLRLYNARKSGGDRNAAQVLEQWLTDNPAHIGVAMQLAEYYSTEKRAEDAIKTYRRVLEVEPDNPIALNNVAWLYYERGQPGDLQRGIAAAERAYRQSRTVGPIADTYGWLLLVDGKASEALGPLRDAIAAAPNDGEIRYHYAVALHRNGDSAQARAMLDKLLDSDAKFKSRDEARRLREEL